MYGTFAQDLAVLGCSEGSTWDDIRAAYRSIARRLHGELQRKTPGANERLVDLNVAYDRLTGGWAQKPARPARPARPVQEIACGPNVAARLQSTLRKAAFRAAFDETRDRATGTYGDPRRVRGKSTHATIAVVKAAREGARLALHVDQPLRPGRTLLAVPEIILRRDGGIAFGATERVIEFALSREARGVQLDPARLQIEGDTVASCVIYQP